jgi:hypothetical protein
MDSHSNDQCLGAPSPTCSVARCRRRRARLDSIHRLSLMPATAAGIRSSLKA